MPIFPVNESLLRDPETVKGTSLLILPNDVLAVTVKPVLVGRKIRIGANEVFIIKLGQA